MKPIGKYYLSILELAEADVAKKLEQTSPSDADYDFDKFQVIKDSLSRMRNDIQQRVTTPWVDYGHDDVELPIDDIADNYVNLKQLHGFLMQATRVTWGKSPDAPVLEDWSAGPLSTKLFLKFRDATGALREFRIDIAAGIIASGKDNRVVISGGVEPDVVLILYFFKQEPLPLKEMKLFPLKTSDVISKRSDGRGCDR
jgi:hypothetical protein